MRMLDTLFARSTVLIFVLVLLLQTMLAFLSAKFLLLPLVQRSATDLAELVISDVRTLTHLPDTQRASYMQQIQTEQQLHMEIVTTAKIGNSTWLPYIQLLEQYLSKHTQHPVKIWRDTSDQYWVDIRIDSSVVRVQFSHERIGTQPEAAFLAIMMGSLLISFIAALVLARGLTRPLARLATAAQSLGQGIKLEPIPEDGPREIAQLAQRFNLMAQQVRELLDNRTTLLAGISHDLRTPIARLRLALELTQQNPNPDQFLRCERYLDEMSELLSLFLDFSRGIHSQEKIAIEIRPFLENLRGENVWRIQVHIAANVPTSIDTAEIALRRVLHNLLGNALRYAADSPIELRCEHQVDQLLIDVSDRGPGIPVDQLDAVMRPFVRLESSRSLRTGGSGLGLAIVKQICQSQGWQFQLLPRPGGGLTARVILPLALLVH